MVEEELAVAGAGVLGTDVVEAFQQRHEPVELFQTDNVAVAQLAGLQLGHALDMRKTHAERKGN